VETKKVVLLQQLLSTNFVQPIKNFFKNEETNNDFRRTGNDFGNAGSDKIPRR
jgi:hypothetical protein